MRTYYDHEPAYRAIAESGGSAWDDLPALKGRSPEAYLAIESFVASTCATPGDALDLGCGGGQVSVMLAARGYRVVGVDFAPTAVALAKRTAPELTFVVGDALALEIPSSSFDLVVDNHVLHCILGADRARFLGEVRRVLRPGGLLFSETMSREGDVDLERHGFDAATFVSRGRNRYLVGETELDSELTEGGFEILFREWRPSVDGTIGHLVRVARVPS